MAQQNKTHSVDSRRAELEADLIADSMQTTKMVQNGRRHVNEGTAFQRRANRADRVLTIQQGFRRRHPKRVLSQYDGVYNTTSDASSSWEKAMLHETERVDLPKEFRPNKDTMGMTNQLGIVTTAADNYKKHRKKLERMFLVGA